MNIFVLVNQTFDTEEYVVIQDGVLSEEGVKWILNPFAPDESHVSAITSQERLAGNTVRVHRDAEGEYGAGRSGAPRSLIYGAARLE
ncbi:hypothetical protein [Paenibacillus dendritiformis]|uniref:hypothetical protein n=1 Tax=Paenibacillus dendritiformis TaxID=130049 RepID=UPI00387E1D77